MWSQPSPERVRARHSAFMLIELMVAMLVLAILLAGLSIPLSTQVQLRRSAETRRVLEEAREALLGFAAAHARLPCPADSASRGLEGFAPGGDPANGQCASFQDGYLPAASLGLTALDEEGFLRDAWSTQANRIRYSVFGAEPVNGVAHALTRDGGMQAATVAGLGAAPHYLLICASGSGVPAASCGPAANQLTRRAVLVVHSIGPDAENPSDDIVTWVPLPVLVSRMIAAGRLP
jgi:type II secretory pathway pseudopilin PulG